MPSFQVLKYLCIIVSAFDSKYAYVRVWVWTFVGVRCGCGCGCGCGWGWGWGCGWVWLWVGVGVGGCGWVCGRLWVWGMSVVRVFSFLCRCVKPAFFVKGWSPAQHCTDSIPASILSLNGWSPALHTVLSCFYPFIEWLVSSTAHSFILLLSFL